MDKKHNLTPEQLMQFEKMRQMSPDEYEKLCKKCGICCLCKTGTHNTVFYTRLCCNCLDIKTKKCTIYKDRLTKQEHECQKVTPELVLDGNLVPRTCGYVEYIFGPAPEPINLDWSTVRHCGDMDVSDFMVALKTIILGSSNWKQR